MIMVDTKGILNRDRKDIWSAQGRICRQVAPVPDHQRRGARRAASPKPWTAPTWSSPWPSPARHVIQPEWIAQMAKDAIVFACANPIPEIWPWEAEEAGARIVATGRSDFPNQVNNSLGFPAIFRGALDVRATTITDEMCIAAAEALAGAARRRHGPDCILPTMDDTEVFAREAVAVGMKAQEQGIARSSLTADELFDHAAAMILRSRRCTEAMMETGLIVKPPEVVGILGKLVKLVGLE